MISAEYDDVGAAAVEVEPVSGVDYVAGYAVAGSLCGDVEVIG